jgi:O-antigen biosynthesis protein
MDISVVIVNYNVRDFLNNALVSLSKSLDGLHSEIFVVDNASDDGSVELVRKKFPTITLISNLSNLGFAKANNQALVRSTGRYIVLLNPDTLVQEDTFKKLIQHLDHNPQIGMAGCKILNPDGTLQSACRRSFPTPWVAFTKTFGLSTLFPHSKFFGRYNLTFLNEDEIYEVDAISGSFMMIRREVFEKIGGLDESFFMYGEDLDWCFRVKQSGWKVFYVPITSIIHYKGESTKRSNIDDLKVFYTAMRLFVRKYHTGSVFFVGFILLGIYIRKFAAVLARIGRPLLAAFVDSCIVCSTILIGEYLRKNDIFSLPQYAYPWVFLIPTLVVIISLFSSGVYSYRKLSISRSFVSTFGAFVFISALTAFEKSFAFSRAIMLISGGLSVLCIPGWRLLLRIFGFGKTPSRATLFGRRTLIVGINQSGKEVLKKLRARIGGGYSVVGFVDINRLHVGEKINDIEIIGSIETIGKLLDDFRITEVIFAADSISYSTMLNIIANNRNRFVNFRLVPNNLEVIIGKPSVDQLDEIPLIDIEYNIGKLPNRFGKRLFDLLISVFLLISIAPFVYFSRIFSSKPVQGFRKAVLYMPKVFLGSMSVVGLPNDFENSRSGDFRGKYGVTGIIQIHDGKLTEEECEQFILYYAKNQSFLLDLEILVKTLQLWIQK